MMYQPCSMQILCLIARDRKPKMVVTWPYLCEAEFLVDTSYLDRHFVYVG
jgi:hypothetical protein